MTPPLLIIGAGLAGWTAAREFRKLDATTPLVLITADSGDFYAKPSLSNAFAQQRTPALLVTTPATQMAQTLQVTLMAHTQVTGIDPVQRLVHTRQGDLGYRDLVLATGAQAIRLPLAGNAVERVLSVNSLQDFSVFHAYLTSAGSSDLNSKKHVVIMGAGLIGCEFANDLASAGFAVTVVDPSASPIAALLPLDAGAQLQSALHKMGVNWRLGTTVQSVSHHSTTDPLDVMLANGEHLHADVVLSAIGLRADLSLAQAAGLACDRGIRVNAQLQTSAEHVYALGDAAQYAQGRTLPYVMPIMHAAKALAATLNGQATPVQFPLMPVAIKTPALPWTVAAPAPGTAGQWHLQEPGIWQFVDAMQVVRGFALAGQQTSRRAEWARQVVPSAG